MELPILAESAQATLKDIGIKVEVNSNANHLQELKKGAYDVYASAMVTAPTGDPEYFFASCCLTTSTKNRGFYHQERLDTWAKELHGTFDAAKRGQIATQMQQLILDDCGYIFASHLQMSLVAKSKVKGLVAHPCDYYEITADLDI
jgi:peptide/nickel transport system substrate-binding protein